MDPSVSDPSTLSTIDNHIVVQEQNIVIESGDKYVPIRDATMLTSIPPQLLRKYADDGTIKSYKTPSGHRRFSYDDLQRIKSKSARKAKTNSIVKNSITKEKLNRTRIHFIYVRAATEETAQDQKQFIQTTCTESGTDVSNYTIVSDVGVQPAGGKLSKGLTTLIEATLRGTVGDVVIFNTRNPHEIAGGVAKPGGSRISIGSFVGRMPDEQLMLWS
jgi:DNA-binding transcriptional MerR regulator